MKEDAHEKLRYRVEYNPFHNGHRYHVEMARKTTGAEVVIAVMSGNFLQRGEPAIIDKWHRANEALQNGVDLVRGASRRMGGSVS